MTGQERILAIRMAGLKPAAVFVTDVPGYLESTDVHVAPDDVPETLDLRFLVDLTVHVSVADTQRGQRIADACAAACGRCITSFASPTPQTTAEHCLRITDTKENQAWTF